jgi:hypothetical protein
MNSQKTQKIFNVGDLVEWKALVRSVKPGKPFRNVEALGIVKKIIGRDTLELKVVSANKDCREYLNALKDLSAWENLPVSIIECEVRA